VQRFAAAIQLGGAHHLHPAAWARPIERGEFK